MATTKKAGAAKSAAPKKATGAKPVAPKDELSRAALDLAVSVLKSEDLRHQLARAPTAAVAWAREHRAERPSTPDESSDESTRRSSPADHFGQRGLERRVERLTSALTSIFGERETTSNAEVWTALDEINRSITLAAGLPILKRKRMHLRIDDALDELEVGLMNAVMPGSSSPDTSREPQAD